LVARAIEAEGERNSFSSAREALDRLPAWDQVHRLDKFWSEVCGAQLIEEGMDDLQSWQRQRYLAATARCFFIGLVARILEPGCKVDSIVILEGAQGSFKSTLLRVIAFDEDQWFSDSMTADLKNKDARAHLRGKLIIELAELSQFRSTKIEGLKAFLSAQDDKYRPPYGKGEVTYKRQCTFVGTTNDTDYLVDLTGNRRFWPIRCGEINIAVAREMMPQLYAEALHWWRAGERWHLPKDIELIAEDEQRERLSDDPWEDKARELVEEKRGYAKGMWAWVSTGELLTLVGVALDKRDRAAEMRAGKLLTKLSGKRMKRPRGEGWPTWGYRFSPNR
jgi:predicted P-loop ATPase